MSSPYAVQPIINTSTSDLSSSSKINYIIIITTVVLLVIVGSIIFLIFDSSDTKTSISTTTTTTPPTPAPTPPTPPTPTPPTQASQSNLIFRGISNTGLITIENFTDITKYNYEHFDAISSEETEIINDNITFSSVDIIKQNFDVFIKTYFPLLNLNRMNMQNKQRTGKTLKQLISESRIINIAQINRILTNPNNNYKKYLGLIYGMTDKTYLRLHLLYILLVKKFSSRRNNLCFYHFPNEPENNNDFIIYVGNCQQINDIKVLRNTKKNNRPINLDGINFTNNTPFTKLTLKGNFLQNFKKLANLNLDSEINIYVNSLQSQRDVILRNYEDEIVSSIINVST